MKPTGYMEPGSEPKRSLAECSRGELLAIAQRLRILGRTVLTKTQLIRAIERKQAAATKLPVRHLPPLKAIVRGGRKRMSTQPLPARPLGRPSASRRAASAGTPGPDARAATPSASPMAESVVPERYGHTILIAQARDPHWLHAYWEILDGDWAEARRTLGSSTAGARGVLRVYELTRPAVEAVRRWFDVPLTPEARDWFVEVGQPASWWRLELGLRAPDGRFVCVAQSNLVETPSDQPSSEVDEAWGLLGEAFASQYRLSGPPGTSPGSPRWGPR